MSVGSGLCLRVQNSHRPNITLEQPYRFGDRIPKLLILLT